MHPKNPATDDVRVPGHDGQDSGMMADSIPE
jgi:hypothetical protein